MTMDYKSYWTVYTFYKLSNLIFIRCKTILFFVRKSEVVVERAQIKLNFNGQNIPGIHRKVKYQYFSLSPFQGVVLLQRRKKR